MKNQLSRYDLQQMQNLLDANFSKFLVIGILCIIYANFLFTKYCGVVQVVIINNNI
jgi:hypothetical protein